MLETLNAFTNDQKKSPANRQPIGTEEAKKRPSCPEEELAIPEPESAQPLPFCEEPEMLQEKAESNIKQNVETQPDTSVQEQMKNNLRSILPFPGMFVKAHEKQVKDAIPNARRSYAFANPFDYGSKEYMDQPRSKMKESKERDLDLRSNPFQVEGDDMIMHEQGAEEELEHELNHTSFNSIELGTTHRINLEKELELGPDEALIIQTGLMTWSKAKKMIFEVGERLPCSIKGNPPDTLLEQRNIPKVLKHP
ncbi:unnamed protein product [Arabidopsis arenosa]|uniref:Uncharacterized protein n=1 Tax=Arabidopsis arenosa TaxID=38785 RepID=A0A8S2AJZ4_ARAAE|nr:unnamed protein product [Arabidopsis arenosa]